MKDSILTRIAVIGIVFLCFGSLSSAYANEKVVVVTSTNNQVDELKKRELIDLYMGKYSAFSNGKAATPIDIVEDEKLKEQFYKELVGLPLARVNAYWSRLKFSGRAKPPSTESSIADIQRRLVGDESALAYVYESKVTNDMKVVYRFD